MTRIRRALIFRADATTRMGAGHVMRCLALAQAWKNNAGDVVFITNCETDTLARRLRDEKFQVIALPRHHLETEDWAVTSKVLSKHPGSWVVTDGYHFDSAYQSQIKALGHPLCVIDDMVHLDHYHCDVLINQNLHATMLDYTCDKDALQLLGRDYVMLRREFLNYRGWKRDIPEKAQNILVTLGGADPDNMTLKVIRAVNALKDTALNLKVVVGPLNPHLRRIEAQLDASDGNGRLINNADCMAKLMAWADLAISASGSTSWELAFMGLPSLVIVMAENQAPVAKALQNKGVCNNLGRHVELAEADITHSLRGLLTDLHQRQNMSAQGRKLIGGNGAETIVANLLEIKR